MAAAVVPVTRYVDASAMECPIKTNSSFPPVYNTCVNHGLDSTACFINEFALWIFVAMIVVGALRGFYLAYLAHGADALQRCCATCSRPQKSESRTMLEEFDKTWYTLVTQIDVEEAEASSPWRSRRANAQLMHLKLKETELRCAYDTLDRRQAMWSSLARFMGMYNLTVPAISIVLQGVLKASDNAHHADNLNSIAKEQNVTTIHYEDYDLNECARVFRQGSVAAYTILAIVLQGVVKVYKPDEKVGEIGQQKKIIQKRLDKFENDLVKAGQEDGKDPPDH